MTTMEKLLMPKKERFLFYSTFLLMCLLVERTNGQLFLSIDSSTVGEGTITRITCYGSVQDENIFSTGGRIEWERITRYSNGLQQVYIWTRSNDGEPNRLNERFSVTGGLSSQTTIDQTLAIRNTSKTDQGSYSCAIYDRNGKKVTESQRVKIKVRYPPAEYYPVCSATPMDAVREIDLNCKSESTTPPVSVQWYRNGVKVADGHALGVYTESSYSATSQELSDRFECRLVYNDGVDVEDSRSCSFGLPQVVILRTGEEMDTKRHSYHAFAHSNPPLVSDIECFFESSTGTAMEVITKYSWYTSMLVGPVALADNGTDLVCRVKNVFGWGEARMVIFSHGEGTQRGETTMPSMVTNYNPNEGTLTASIWPNHPSVALGDNVTFVCSYSLVTHSSSRDRVDIRWKFNDIDVNRSTSRFTEESNSLHVRGITPEDNGARVTCIVTIGRDETSITNSLGSEPATTIRVSDGVTDFSCRSNCMKNSAPLPYGETSILRHPSFIIGVAVLAAVGWLIVVVLILLLIARKKKQRQSNTDHKARMQLTYRANSSNAANGHSRGLNQVNNPSLRALPAEPNSNSGATTSTATSGRSNSNLHVSMPIEVSKPEFAYQEMVGNTGITKSRNGDAANANGVANGISNIRPSNVSPSAPPALVPVHNGGFIPQDMLATNAVSSEKSGGPHEGEMNYEDLDWMRQQHAPRATGNDYQTSTSNTPCPRLAEEQELLPHYANS